MAPQVSDEMRARIAVWHEEKQLSPKEIADLAGCCVRTVYYILSYHREFNLFRDPFTPGAHGQPRKLDTGDMNVMIPLVASAAASADRDKNP
jgi:transposase